jgi:hypothetical protein
MLGDARQDAPRLARSHRADIVMADLRTAGSHRARGPFWTSVAVAAGLAVAALIVWTRVAAKAEADATAQRLQRIEQIQQEQARLLAALLQQQSPRRATLAQLPPTPRLPDRATQRDAPAQLPPEVIARDLDAQHRRDPIDPTWSAQAETELTRLARGDWVPEVGGAPTRLIVDCRSTRCRIEAEFVRRSQAEDWSELFLTQAGGTIYRSQTVLIPRTDGGAELRLYSTRKPGG